MITILAAILDDSLPSLALLQGFPQVGKNLLRHIRMTNHIVIRPYQFFSGVSAGFHECGVGVGDLPLQISASYQQLLMLKLVFPLRHRLVIAHCIYSLSQPGSSQWSAVQTHPSYSGAV